MPPQPQLFFVPKTKHKVFRLAIKSHNLQFPNDPVILIHSYFDLERMLRKHRVSLLFWYCEFQNQFPKAQLIQKQCPYLKWVLICESKNVVAIRRWLYNLPIEAVWYAPDLVKFNFWKSFNPKKQKAFKNSETIQKILHHPELKLLPKDLALLKALREGENPKHIQDRIGFSKSNYYYHLESLKDQFKLAPESTLIKLIFRAMDWGYME
jgi:hypothetical protein